MQEQIDLLVTGGTVVTQNPAREIIRGRRGGDPRQPHHGCGPGPELDASYEARRRIEAVGRYVFPGLINTHTHLFPTFMKGLGEGLPLYEWIDTVTAAHAIGAP